MISEHPRGCVLKVHAQPGAKRCGLIGVHGDAVKVAVNAPADKGRANDAVVKLLAEILEIKTRQIELLSGQSHRDKQFLILGLTANDLQSRLNL